MSKQVSFTPRQNQVMWWTCQGKTYEEISIILGIELCSVKFHMKLVVKKLDASNSRQAVYLATKNQLVTPES